MMTLDELRRELEAVRQLSCIVCGLLGEHGCQHTTLNYRAPSLTVTAPAHLFAPLARKVDPRPFTIRINAAGLPIR